MDNAYAAAYPALYHGHWWWRVRERILLDTITGLLRDRRGPARILDVGCGAGLFFDALSGFGDVYGIESDAIAVQRSGRWRQRIHLGELDSSFTAVQPFDLVLMLDVLEHVKDPAQLLRSAVRVLSPTGSLLITVPAFTWLWTTHDVMNQHVTRYDAAQLRRVVADTGLTRIHTQYLFQSLVLPKLAVRLSEAIFRSEPQLPQVPVPLLNRILQVWFRAEHALAGWLPFGSSLMAVVRTSEP